MTASLLNSLKYAHISASVMRLPMDARAATPKAILLDSVSHRICRTESCDASFIHARSGKYQRLGGSWTRGFWHDAAGNSETSCSEPPAMCQRTSSCDNTMYWP